MTVCCGVAMAILVESAERSKTACGGKRTLPKPGSGSRVLGSTRMNALRAPVPTRATVAGGRAGGRSASSLSTRSVGNESNGAYSAGKCQELDCGCAHKRTVRDVPHALLSR